MEGLRNTLQSKSSWMWLYIAGMVPTYILPYMGSNSLFIGAASGGATAPLFAVHLACLIALIVFAKLRGEIIGKSWLISLPIGAAIFDMVPLLNWIPLVPTLFHIGALVVGMEDPRKNDPDVFR